MQEVSDEEQTEDDIDEEQDHMEQGQSEGQHHDEDDDNGVYANSDEDSDDELCLMCGQRDRLGGATTIDWINCTDCQQWVHEGCLPCGYCFDSEDDDFVCPVCLTGENINYFYVFRIT